MTANSLELLLLNTKRCSELIITLYQKPNQIFYYKVSTQYLMDPHITISKLLDDLNILPSIRQEAAEYIEQIESEESKYKFQTLNYYASKNILGQYEDGSFTWQEVVDGRSIASTAQLVKIYSTVNRKILELKYKERTIVNQSIIFDEDESNTESKSKYLALKSQVFHKMYLPQSAFNQDYSASKNGFNTDELQQFGKYLTQLSQNLLKEVRSINVSSCWYLKIQIYYLLHQLGSLMQQLRVAAYPFFDLVKAQSTDLYCKSLEMKSYIKVLRSQEDRWREEDGNKVSQFDKFMPRQNYLSLAIALLQTKMEELRELGRQAMATVNSMDGGRTDKYTLDSLQSLVIILKLVEFASRREEFDRSSKQIDMVRQIIAKDPLNTDQMQNLEGLKYLVDNRDNMLEKYYHLYYSVIARIQDHKLVSIYEDYGISQEEISRLEVLMRKSLAVCRNQILHSNYTGQDEYNFKTLVHLQNYVQVLKISNKKEEQFFETYLKILSKRMQKQTIILKLRMERIDQDITYQMLVNKKLLSHFTSYKNVINSALQEMIPILLMFTQIKKIKEEYEKRRIVFLELAARFRYLSLLNQSTFQTLGDKNQLSYIEQVIELCDNDYSLIEQVPHLLELRNMLILIETLQSCKRKTRSNHENIFINEKYMQEVADYFSLDRVNCKIYQLKSKMLLFAILFKMGHYIPVIKQGNQHINLRQRIINLMINQGKVSHGQSQIMTSKINRNNIASSIYVYDRDEQTITQVSNILNNKNHPRSVQIEASQELKEKVQGYVEELYRRDENWINYITQRLDIIEHELFMAENVAIKQEQVYLCEQYIKHIKNSLADYKHYEDVNKIQLKVFLQIQSFFFEERYEKGWELFRQEKGRNSKFEIFLDKILGFTHNQLQSYKFLKVYRQFDKIEAHLRPILTHQRSLNPQEMQRVTEIMNQNTVFPFEEKEVASIVDHIQRNISRMVSPPVPPLQVPAQEESIMPSQQIVEQNQPIKQQQKVQTIIIPRLAPFEGITITQKDSTIKLVRISQGGKRMGKQIQEYMAIINEVGLKGISTIKNIYYTRQQGRWKDDIFIEIEQHNPFQVQSYQTFQSKNFEQRLIKAFIFMLVQILRKILVKEKYIDFELDINSEIKVDLIGRSFMINFCYVVIEKVCSKYFKRKAKAGSIVSSIEQVVEPLIKKVSAHCEYNYSLLLKSLKTQYFMEQKTLSSIINSTLLLTQSEQIKILVNFYQKMGQINRSFGLIKSNNDTAVIKQRKDLMSETRFKNYTYNFKIGSIMQMQAIERKVCQIYGQPSGVNAPFVWFDVSRKTDTLFNIQQLAGRKTQQKYSLWSFIRELKMILTQKESNSKTMETINNRFPKLIHFLRKNSKLLDMKYQQMIAQKNEKLCKMLGDGQNVTKIIKTIMSSRKVYSKLHEYNASFIKHFREVERSLASNRCSKCSPLIRIIQTVIKEQRLPLISFLTKTCQLIPKDKGGRYTTQGALSSEHLESNYCFLSFELQKHQAVKILGKEMKTMKPLAKYYLVINWWFYLESLLPLMIDLLGKVYSQIIV